MASRHGHAQDERGGELGAMDDADVADLWILDPVTGEFRMKTPEEVEAENVVTVEPTEAPVPGGPTPSRRSTRRQPPPRARRSAGSR